MRKGIIATRSAKLMLSWMNLTDEAGCLIISNDGQGLITIDDFSQLNEKFLDGLCQVLQRPGGNIEGVSNPGVSVSAIAKENLQGIIYYIKHFETIGRTCMHAYV